nr:hypothetical protein [Mycoplasmopsis bovis]
MAKKIQLHSIKDMIGKLKEKFDAVNDKVVFNLPIEFKHTEEVKIKPGNGEREVPIWRGRAQQTNLGTFVLLTPLLMILLKIIQR